MRNIMVDKSVDEVKIDADTQGATGGVHSKREEDQMLLDEIQKLKGEDLASEDFSSHGTISVFCEQYRFVIFVIYTIINSSH